MTTTVLGVISSIVLVFGAATCIPRAAAHLVRACIPLVTAITELRAAIINNSAREVPPEIESSTPPNRRSQ
jgi:hypothetical protein